MYTRSILNDAEIEEILSLKGSVSFEDGVNTLDTGSSTDLNKTHQMKWCLNHTSGCPNSQRIGELVFAAIDRDVDFLDTTAASSSGFPIISRTEDGMYYRPHNDTFNNGEYSTTVFLSDPMDYEGGELRLKIGQDIHEFKLPFGHAVTYSTGIPHEVATVTQGTRDVAVFWTKSKYRDPNKRFVYSQIMRASRRISPMETYPQSLEEYTEDPFHILNSLLNEYQRIYPPNH